MTEKGAFPQPRFDDQSGIVVRPNPSRYFQGVLFFLFVVVMFSLLLEGQYLATLIAFIFVVYSGINFLLILLEWYKVDSSGFTHHARFHTIFIASSDVTRIHYEAVMSRYMFIVVTGYEKSIRFPIQYRRMGAFCLYVMNHYPRELWVTAEEIMNKRIGRIRKNEND